MSAGAQPRRARPDSDGSGAVSMHTRGRFSQEWATPVAPPPDERDFPLLFDDGDPANAASGDVVQAAARSLRQPDTPLLAAFFSRANLEALQRDLLERVRERVGLDVGRQSDRELALVMRRVYVRGADPYPENVDQEVLRLNTLVLTRAVDTVSQNVVRYLSHSDGVGRPVAMPAPGESWSSTPAPVVAPENVAG